MKATAIMTRGRRRFDFAHPKSSAVSIVDIAHALSNLCRFCGHASQFYSVAQHSVVVSEHVAPGHALDGLLHDAAEAYICDVPSPLKYLPEMAGYREVEGRVARVVAERFGLAWPPPTDVVEADLRAAVTEAKALGLYRPEFDGIEPLPVRLAPLAPVEARAAFVRRYAELRAMTRRSDK